MTAQPPSIADFITDGSLIRLCEVIGRILGARVELRDHAGRVITALVEGRVAYRDAPAAIGAVAGGVGSPSPPPAPAEDFAAPLVVDSEVVGHIAITGPASADDGRRALLDRFIDLLARTVSEVCQRETDQRRRAEELQSLYKLSSLLVGAGAVGAMLEAGLREAASVLGADAGVVRLIDDESGELQVRARVGADGPGGPCEAPLDEGRDRAAMTGEVVCVENLAPAPGGGDGRAASGARAVASAGLMFQGRPQGVICLFWRDPRAFTQAERGLFQSIGQQLAAAVANARLLAVEADSRRVAAQVRLAADIQRRMLPRSAPALPSLDVDARYVPCFELGGDFYDIFDLGGHLGVVVGDVSGKGVAAALLMAHVRASLRAHARDLYDLDEVMARTNQALCRDTLSNEFATIFYGVIDPKTLRLTYCNAGHEPPLVVRRPGDGPATFANISELATGGMVVGVDPEQRYQRGSFDMRPGDVMLVYTDGLADAMSFDNQKFGKRRIRQALLDILAVDPGAPAKRIAQHVHWEMRRFAGLNTRTDDTTIVVVRAGGAAV